MRNPFPHPKTTMRNQPIISAAFATDAEVELVKKAAKSLGMTVSSFLREVALSEAARVAARDASALGPRELALAKAASAKNRARRNGFEIIEGGRAKR